MNTLFNPEIQPVLEWLLGIAIVALVLWRAPLLLGIRYIPHSSVGIIEKLWSLKGSLKEGRIVAANGEAGFQPGLLRGGLHWGFSPWQ